MVTKKRNMSNGNQKSWSGLKGRVKRHRKWYNSIMSRQILISNLFTDVKFT